MPSTTRPKRKELASLKRASALAAGAFHFFVRTKKRNKEKRRLRSGAKKSSHFPKRKELASLKQLFVLNGKYSIFLHAPPLRPEANEEYGKNMVNYKAKQKKKRSHPNERSDVALKNIKVRPHFFAGKRRERDEALKRKSCLSEASSFSLAESPTGVGKKSADGEFSLFRFFCSGKRNEMPLRHEQQRSVQAFAAIEQKAQRRLSEKQQNASRRMKKFVKAHNEILQDPQCYASRRINQVFNVYQHKNNILSFSTHFFK